MGYEEMSPAADKWLRSDGSVYAMSGTEVLPSDNERAKEYASRAPQAAKWLMPDGSIADVLPDAGAEGTGGIEDAPADGKLYARKDEAWEEIAPPLPGCAANEVSYNSDTSELAASDVQSAIDELSVDLSDVDDAVREHINQAFSDRFKSGSLTLGAASSALYTALEFDGYVIQFARTSTSALRTYVYRKDGENFSSVRMGSYGTNSANGTVTVKSSENAANFDLSSTSLSGLNFSYTWLLIGPGGKQTLVYYNFANWTTAAAGGTTIYLTGIKLS